MYKAIKKPNGNYEVYKDGSRISTTIASGLSRFGLSETNLGGTTVPTTQPVAPIIQQTPTGSVPKPTPQSTQPSPTGTIYDFNNAIVNKDYNALNQMGVDTSAYQSDTPTKTVTLPNGQEVQINDTGDIVSGLTDNQTNIQNQVNNQTTAAQQTNPFKNVVDVLDKSGYKPNPDLTPEDIAALDPKNFMQQAEGLVAPFYKQEFNQAKTDFGRILDQIKGTYGRNEQDINRQTEQAQLTGRESLAGRGLAFSGQRNTFEQNTLDTKQRAEDQARRLAFNQAGTVGRSLERQLGTANIGDLQAPQINGRSLFNFSQEPVIGTLERQRLYEKKQMARQLSTDAARKRGYLAFA